MVFFYDPRCKEETLELTDDNFTHLIKARRSKVGDLLDGRNFQDSNLYTYKIESIQKRKAYLVLDSFKASKSPGKPITLAWCVVDGKTVEKTLPFLNELGVEKLFFIYSQRSQKNIKLNIHRLEKILINSSCQCGRSTMMTLESFDSLGDFLKRYPKSSYLNFGGREIVKESFDEPIIVGPEGGFSKIDLEELSGKNPLGVQHSLILRSETAITSLASLGAFL